MRAGVQSFRAHAGVQVQELLQAVEASESVIISTIERECEALRAGRLLAADALRMRLRDAAKLYLNITRAARAALWTIEQLLPGSGQAMEERRLAFGAVLKVQLAVLAAERAAAESNLHLATAPTPRPIVPDARRRPKRRAKRMRRPASGLAEGAAGGR